MKRTLALVLTALMLFCLLTGCGTEGGEYIPTDKDIHSFALDRPEAGFISLIGIKTPGLSCANELGSYCAKEIAIYLGTGENTAFSPKRKAIVRPGKLAFEAWQSLAEKDPDYGDIICLCENISRAEIKEAIRRGAKDVEGIKRRLGSAMGPCQGSRCSYAISRMLEEAYDTH